MPLEHRVEVSLRTVFTKPFGAFTDEDARGHVKDLRKHPDFESDFNQLFDAREVTSVGLSGACVREVAATRFFGEGSLRAFVVGTDIAFGMVRMFEMLREFGVDILRVAQMSKL